MASWPTADIFDKVFEFLTMDEYSVHKIKPLAGRVPQQFPEKVNSTSRTCLQSSMIFDVQLGLADPVPSRLYDEWAKQQLCRSGLKRVKQKTLPSGRAV